MVDIISIGCKGREKSSPIVEFEPGIFRLRSRRATNFTTIPDIHTLVIILPGYTYCYNVYHVLDVE